MVKQLAESQVYVLNFDHKYDDVEVFGSITEMVNYLKKLDITNLNASKLRKVIVSAMNNYKDFQLEYENLGKRDFFVSKHRMKIECRMHS